nr:MAG TPA: hypothetical protein [Caudoviricetes sp.]
MYRLLLPLLLRSHEVVVQLYLHFKLFAIQLIITYD